MKRGNGGNGDAGFIIRLAGAFQNTVIFTELTTNFFNHFAGRFGDGFHGDRGKQESEHPADKQTDDDFRGQNIDSVKFDGLGVGNEKRQGGQSRRADGKSFTDGGRGIPDGIQGIGDFTDTFVKTAHFGDPAGVVGDGTVSVNGDGAAGGSQHPDGGQSDTVKTGCHISDHDADDDENDRNGGGVHPDGKT